jgi:hypothetical protein
MGLRRERLTSDGLRRWASDQLCDVPLNAGGGPVIIVNGIDVYVNMPKSFLCFWRVDEIELLEFGPDACKEVTGTIVQYVRRVACGGRSRGGAPGPATL